MAIIIKYIIISVFLLLCTSIQAEELVIYLIKGGQVTFGLEKKPIITFENDCLVVKGVFLDYSIHIDEVQKYNVNAEATKLDNIWDGHDNPIVFNNHVALNGLPMGTQISVYDIEGKKLRTYNVDRFGNVDVDLTSYSKGVYILKTPSYGIKVSKR